MTGAVDTHSRDLIEQGHAAFTSGDMATAEAQFRAALEAGADRADVHDFLAFLARRRGALDDAGDHYAAALERAPADAAICNNLASVRRDQKRMAEAIALFRRAGELAPDQAPIQVNLGSTLLAARRPDLAITALERALALEPGMIAAHDEAAVALSALGRYQDTLAHYRAIHHRMPANNNARYLEGLALLALGDYANGWRKHEARLYAPLGRDYRMRFPQPAWTGEDDIAGRTILLHAEQGLGDVCQFVRYAPMVAARGARVLLLVPAALQPLLATMPGIAEVFRHGQPVGDFDLHCSLMSLPRAFRTGLATIPAAMPYLAAPPDRVLRWSRRLGPGDGRRRIALAWSGSDTIWNRAIPLAMLAPVLARPDCEFHVAQTAIRPPDRQTLAQWPGIVDHSAELGDFADTAALLTLMDQVLTIDTVLAHLAGAMALPVWTMLPVGADYRWMTQGETTPWYPTMRLFRQPAFADWDSVIAAVARAMDAASP